MIRQEEISTVIDAQKELFINSSSKITREVYSTVPVIENFVTIITGIRRCGKSTLLLQVLKDKWDDTLFLNFEDIRLTGFETNDFIRLEKEISKRGAKFLFFDEIQLIKSWEIFVHQLLNQGYQIFVTGSNASLLSKELGTHLTGRQLSMELFPFSYAEYLLFKEIDSNEENFIGYLNGGGMPEYVKNQYPQIISNLLNDILIRDIAVRYGIREVDTLKKLAVYLITNVGKPVSGNNLAKVFGFKSTTTIIEFFNYLRDSYLVEFLPQFHFSLKAQIRNPKKVYTLDNGFNNVLSLSNSDDQGRKLENTVYQYLRRNSNELFYFKEKRECDFLVFENNQLKHIIQVCYQLTDENFEREYDGLIEAMKFFDKNEGIIVTLNQTDTLIKDHYKVEIVPAYEFLLSAI
jgi:predicted AAA+ superfamily ATPase